MTQTPHPGPQIDAEAPEDDDVADDTGDLDAEHQDDDGDGHPFTAQDYASAAAELAAEAEDQQTQVLHDVTPDDGDGEPPADDKLYVQKLRREAAEKRVAAQELGEKLKAADQRIDALQQWRADRLRRDVEALAGHKLVDPAEVWHVTELTELLDEGGDDIDEQKLADVIAARVPAHWRVTNSSQKGPNYMGSGATKRGEPRPASWASAIGPQQG